MASSRSCMNSRTASCISEIDTVSFMANSLKD
jgi:hypothetical protein